MKNTVSEAVRREPVSPLPSKYLTLTAERLTSEGLQVGD